MIYEYFSNKEIMEAINKEVDNEVARSEFNAIGFKMPDNKIIYGVGLFINYAYILDSDIFEANIISEVKSKVKELAKLINKTYGIESTYNIDCNDGKLKIENQKIS